MTGGLIQLISSGTQDVYLTGNPQITFFKSLYKKYSKFALDTVEQTINGNPNFDSTFSCSIDKSGDLLKNIYIELTLPDLVKPNNASWVGYTNNIGCSILESVTLRINDQIIDKIYGEWIDIYSNTSNKSSNYLTLQYNSDYSIRNTSNVPYEKRHLYIPFPFWFTKNTGCALPLVALLNSDISIDVKFRPLRSVVKCDNYALNDTIKTAVNSEFSCKVWTEYVYLSDTEKAFFTKKDHTYLIEQLQYNGDDVIKKEDTKKNIYIDFINPIKELYWVISVDNNNIDTTLEDDANGWTKYTTAYSNYMDTFKSLSIKLNNVSLIDEREPEFFKDIQSNVYFNNKRNKHIYSYSFNLNPNTYQPSGYTNFSELTSVLFTFDFNSHSLKQAGSSTNGIIKVYGVNYNLLTISSGICKLVYTK